MLIKYYFSNMESNPHTLSSVDSPNQQSGQLSAREKLHRQTQTLITQTTDDTQREAFISQHECVAEKNTCDRNQICTETQQCLSTLRTEVTEQQDTPEEKQEKKMQKFLEKYDNMKQTYKFEKVQPFMKEDIRIIQAFAQFNAENPQARTFSFRHIPDTFFSERIKTQK